MWGAPQTDRQADTNKHKETQNSRFQIPVCGCVGKFCVCFLFFCRVVRRLTVQLVGTFIGHSSTCGEPHWSQFYVWGAPGSPRSQFYVWGAPGEPKVTVLHVGSPRGAPGHSFTCGEPRGSPRSQQGSPRSQFYVWGAPGHSSTCWEPQGSPRSQFYMWGAPGEPQVTVLRVGP